MSKAIKMITIIWSAMAGSAGLVFLNQVLLARTLTVTEFGMLSTLLSLINTLAPLSGIGVAGYWLRINGKGKSISHHTAHASFFLLFVTSLTIFGACCILTLMSWQESSAFWLCILLSPIILMQAAASLGTSTAQITGNFKALSSIQIAPQVGRILSTVIGAVMLGSLWLTALGYGISALVIAAATLLYTKKHVTPPQKPKMRQAKHMLSLAHASSPFAVNQFLNLVILQGGVYLAAITLGTENAGQYSICVALLLFIYILPNAIFNQYLLPTLHRLAHTDSAGLLNTYRVGNTLMLSTGTIIAAGTYLLGPFFIRILFGENFSPAANLIQILSAAIPLRFMATSIGSVLITKGVIGKKVLYMTLAAAIQVILIVALTPHWGLNGISIAVIAGELVLVLLYLWGAYSHCFGIAALTEWPSSTHIIALLRNLKKTKHGKPQ